jgi:hypothetical protein
MNIRHLLLAGFLLTTFVVDCTVYASETITEQQLLSRTQELFDGLASANNASWIKYYADNCLFFDEKGRSLEKAALVEEVKQLPKGYRVSFKIEKPQSRIFQNIAVYSYDLMEDLYIFKQHLGAKYHGTDTWMFQNNEWQIIATQMFRYYGDPAPGMSDPARFPEYAGTYELAEGIKATVSTEGANLYYQRGDNTREQLIPEAEGIFFRKGVEGRILFRRDKAGKVDALISRRNHEDLIWKKL